MAGMINRTPCLNCNKVGSLSIEIKLVTKPLGTFSLSGAQMKTTGRMLPVIMCSECGFVLVGEFDGDSHAVFDTTIAQQPADIDAVVDHLKDCRDGQAAIVCDGSGDDVIETMVNAGWTLDDRVDHVGGKRIRTLNAPPTEDNDVQDSG